ncbi:MAG: hypothetical protein GWN61_14015, partial [candidate division Zixibacteria bacterium]|nr:hypothetical protein [candidate division Zixibacteria bacterium]NIR65337.1 hypothetical protein [candidate division Zixibacteria bacterium]NIS47320.1 hypothetical protein [candidate division Zixibacteria bacterium]NIU15436.1 hypothetical protein [candidate division Zixibacteria bacterium]NIV07256.1 hypothetical protein [candidate division Zixibacteria bacterium]
MTNTLIKGLVLCLVIMSGTSAYAGVSEETQIYRYVPHESVLVGTLRLGIFYGPPGYGEYPDTDTKESALILVLDEPIDVIADAEDEYNETRHGITEVQLVFDPV